MTVDFLENLKTEIAAYKEARKSKAAANEVIVTPAMIAESERVVNNILKLCDLCEEVALEVQSEIGKIPKNGDPMWDTKPLMESPKFCEVFLVLLEYSQVMLSWVRIIAGANGEKVPGTRYRSFYKGIRNASGAITKWNYTMPKPELIKTVSVYGAERAICAVADIRRATGYYVERYLNPAAEDTNVF